MTPAESLAAFIADPIGRYRLGRRHVVFAHSSSLLGLASWGKPDADEVREMLEACSVGLRADAVPHAWLADVRHLEFVDPSTFGLFVDYVRTNADALRRKLVRQAQLRPPGLIGAIISGFSAVARLSYPERVFDDAQEAFAWLGVDEPIGVGLLAELDAIRESTFAVHPIVAKVRAQLEARGVQPVDRMARALAISSRTLQRALREAGTTYRAEVSSYQLSRARQLLRADDSSISSVAMEVGFSSLQHFATAFRRATGETPSTFRARHGTKARSGR